MVQNVSGTKLTFAVRQMELLIVEQMADAAGTSRRGLESHRRIPFVARINSQLTAATDHAVELRGVSDYVRFTIHSDASSLWRESIAVGKRVEFGRDMS